MNSNSRIRAILAVSGLLIASAACPARALYTRDAVQAFRVAEGAISVDGRPDPIWRTIFLRQGGFSAMDFQDYSKMVVLQPDSLRNRDPSGLVPNPPTGSATLLAAYDSAALYFFFLIKTGSVANPQALGCGASDLWKPDAAEIYVDPSAWSADPQEYQSYFTADASGLVYGTSPRTIQIDKPIHRSLEGFYYRDRSTGDRFQVPAALPAGISVVASPRTQRDTGWVGVEMRIPYWTSASAFAQGKSLFLSWGFNSYGDSAHTDCSDAPLAYRWAKNRINYDDASGKPPGWRPGDSTHYDPSRSWDGWGRIDLLGGRISNECASNADSPEFDTSWTKDYWKMACGAAVSNIHPKPAPGSRNTNRSSIWKWGDWRDWDVRGRRLPRADYSSH